VSIWWLALRRLGRPRIHRLERRQGDEQVPVAVQGPSDTHGTVHPRGSALVDGGTPFGAGSAVSDDGSTGQPSDLNGYSIIEADNLDEARALTKDHPFLAEGKGRFTIEIFELVPLPM
jgi:hypothetical protein